MSEQATETTPQPAPDTTEADEVQPKATETVEFWKQKAREQEARAKSNAKAATRLAQIEESQKSDAEKNAERLRSLEADALEARRDAMRYKVAAKFQIGDEDAELFLTGTDEETLTRQATRLTVRETEKKKQGNHVPKEGTNPTPSADPAREVVRGLFGGG